MGRNVFLVEFATTASEQEFMGRWRSFVTSHADMGSSIVAVNGQWREVPGMLGDERLLAEFEVKKAGQQLAMTEAELAIVKAARLAPGGESNA